MIQHRYSEKLSGFRKSFGDAAVLFARFELAGRMVVAHQDRRGPVRYRIAEYFARMHDGSVEYPYAHYPYSQHLVGSVERDAEKVFLLPVGVVLDQRIYIGRGFYFFVEYAREAASELAPPER